MYWTVSIDINIFALLALHASSSLQFLWLSEHDYLLYTMHPPIVQCSVASCLSSVTIAFVCVCVCEGKSGLSPWCWSWKEKSFESDSEKQNKPLVNAMIHVSFSECSASCSSQLTSFPHLMCLASRPLLSFSRRVWASLVPLPQRVTSRSVSPSCLYGHRSGQTVE